MSNREYAKKYANLQSDAQRKYGEIKWEKPFNKLVNEYEIKYGKDWVIPFVSEVSFTKESPPDKSSKVKKQAKQLLKEVEATPVLKKVNTTKVNQLLKKVERKAKEKEGFDLISKIESKLKKHATEKDIADIKKMIDQVNSINVSKPKAVKVMQQAKDYVHKVQDVSPRVQNYVADYKSILSSGKTQATITKELNKLKLNVMTNMKPSEVDDANKLISDYKKTLEPKVKPSKVPKTKQPKPDDESYESDKKYKPMIVYVKKHKPMITDPEDIDIIVKEIINKKIPRMSLKKLEEILEDLGL
jgi:hypothetical protein